MDTKFAPLEIVDLDSPFFFGVARKMTPEEKADAIVHGVEDDRPMSILGLSSEGLAAVDGKDWANLIIAAPDLLTQLENLRFMFEQICDAADIDTEDTSIRCLKKSDGAVLAEITIQNAFDSADAAIAKARGVEPIAQ